MGDLQFGARGGPPAPAAGVVRSSVAQESGFARVETRSVQAEAPAARRIRRWVGVVGDEVLVEWGSGEQELLTAAGLGRYGWRVANGGGEWFLVSVEGERVWQ